MAIRWWRMLVDGRFSLPVLKAGGMDLVDHLKEGLAEPDLLVDVKRLRRAGARAPIGRDGGRLAIEATATLTEIAASPDDASHALTDAKSVKIGQNLKYDLNVLRQAGFEVDGEMFDTMIAA